MALYVHVTEECKKTARRHAKEQLLYSLKDRIEQHQNTSMFEHFPTPYWVKKKFGDKQGRLIAALYPHGEDLLLVFLIVMIKGTREYERFSVPESNPDFARQKLHPIFSEADVAATLEERTRSAPLPTPARPSDKAVEFLNIQGDDLSTLGTVYESPHWVNTTLEKKVEERLIDLRRALESLVANISELEPGKSIYKNEELGIRIYYRALPEQNALYLEGLSLRDAGIDQPPTVDRELEGLDDIRKHSAKAYPAIIATEEQFWLDLEKDSEGNLALSEEEIRIFDGVRHGHQPFPLFINGRAGSGKSTLLQYIFAHQLMGYLKIGEPDFGAPVYFTCNDSLLEQARLTVEKLLTCNPEFSGAEPDLIAQIKERKKEIGENFRNFHGYLLSLVPREDRHKFHPDRKITFARFTAMWQQRFKTQRNAREQFGPDISWHVIRTYIKGLSSEDFTDTEEYQHIDRKQRVVTKDAYGLVFHNVWEKWYQTLEDEGWWDDQDLARYLLENNLVQARFPGIFCDEAQDFTRLELEILLRLNLFSERNVFPQEIGQIPFVFAGDPFQTLNPTGFRWESTKAAFVEKFIHALDPTGRSGLQDIHYHELTYNYRSGQEIVKFSNSIQACRSILFDIASLQPQLCWSEINKHASVCSYPANDPDFWNTFREKQDIVLVLPCPEGDEVEFCQQHPELAENITIENGIAERALSSAAAKGQEWPKVAVFGFARCSPQNLFDPLTEGRTHADDPDGALPCEYFLNKLYVAVSRPRNHLYILDSPQDIESWWNRLTSDIISAGDGYLQPDIWENQTGTLVRGSKEDLEKQTGSNPLDLARRFKDLGLAEENPAMMRQAGAAFRNAEESQSSKWCYAMADRFSDNHLQAGGKFLELGDFKAALEDFWEAGTQGRSKIISLNGMENDYRIQACRLISEPQTDELLALLEKIAGQASEETMVFETSVWHRAFADLFKALAEQDLEGFATRAADVTDRFLEHGFPLPDSAKGSIYYKAGKFDQAVEAWDRCESEKVPLSEYRNAQIETMRLPERLKPLSEAGRHAEVLQFWKQIQADNQSVAPAITAAVAKSMIAEDRLTEAYELFLNNRIAGELPNLSRLAFSKGDRDFALRIFASYLILMVDNEEWATIYRHLRHTERELSAVLEGCEFNRKQIREIQGLIVASLARSETFPELDRLDIPGTRLRDFSAFFNREYLKGSGINTGDLLSPFELGAALEKSGNRIFAQTYYEKLIETGLVQEKREVVKRLVVSLERRADLARSKQDTQSEGRFASRAREIRAEYAIAQQTELESYPELSSLDEYLEEAPEKLLSVLLPPKTDEPESAQPEAREHISPSPTTATNTKLASRINSILITYHPGTRKLNLVHEESGESLDVAVHRKQFASVDVDVEDLENGSYEIPSWNLWLDLPGGEEDSLKIYDPETNISVIIGGTF